MKNKMISLLISCFIFSSVVSAQTAGKHMYNFGFDPVTQGLYGGYNHSFGNYSLGLDVGSSFGMIVPLNVSLCLDNAWYFGKPNKYNLKTWHLNTRLAYSKLLVENKPNVLYVIPAIGKAFSLNEKLGLNIELGYAFQLLDDWGQSLTGSGTTYYFGGVSNPNLRLEFRF
jgi:hypothetical protein